MANHVTITLVFQAVCVLVLMFMYRITIPIKMVFGVILSLITFLFIPHSYTNLWDALIWTIWAILTIVSILPLNIKRNAVETNDGQYYRFLNYSTNWNKGRKILSIWGILNKLQRPKAKILGDIIPLNARQARYNNRKIVLSELMESGGTICTGSTGSGKTVTLLSLMSQDLNFQPTLLIDYKGEKEFVEKVRQLSSDVIVIGSYEISQFFYDPFDGMNESSIIEAFLNMRKWDISGSDGHYKTSLQAYLSDIIPIVLGLNEQGSPKPFIIKLNDWLNKNQPINRQDLDSYKTLRNLLGILLGSSFGKVFDGRYKEKLDLAKLKPGQVIVLSFSSDNKGIGTAVTSFFLRDLIAKSTAGKMKYGMGLYIDEFGSMEDKIIVKDILEKGRSLGIKTLLSFQDIHQIAMDTNENYSKTIFGIVNTFIVHPGVTADSAKYYSGIVSSDDMIDQIFINLRKPSKNRPPTCVFITRYGNIKRERKSEMWVFTPRMNNVSLKNFKNHEEAPHAIEAETVQFDLEEDFNFEDKKEPVRASSNHRTAIPFAEDDKFEPLSISDIDKFLK